MASVAKQATQPADSYPNLREVMLDVVDLAISMTSADFGSLQLVDPSSGGLRIVVSRGFPEFWLDYWNSVSDGGGVCGNALASRARVIVDDVERSPIFIGTPSLEIQLKAGVRAVQSTPLVSRSGRVLGVFSTHYKSVKRLSEQELRPLDVLARLAADAIEQGQMQEFLQKSEIRFRALVKASSDVIYRMNPDWTEMRELVGRSFIADTSAPDRDWLTRYIHPDDQPQVLQKIHEAIQNKSTFELEHRVLRVDGSIGWTSSRAIPIKDETGRIIEWFGAASDVTKRREAEEEVREREARLQAFFQTRAVGIAEVSEDGKFLRTNETVARITGYSMDELLKMHPNDLSAPEYAEEHMRAFQKFFEGKSDFTMLTRRFRRKDGHCFWARVTASLLRDKHGKPFRAFVIVEDVTQQKEAEEILAKHEMKFRSIAEAIPGIVWTASPNGSRDYHNRCWFEYTGMTHEESVGWGWCKAVHPDDLPNALEHWARAFVDLENYDVEYRLMRMDGEYRWHLARARPLYDGLNKVQKWIGNATDIHDQKLSLLKLEFERTLRERFVNMLSHDLRTPLSSAMMAVRLLIKQSPPALGEVAQRVEVALNRIDRMIRDLLDANQIRAGQRPKLDLRLCDPVRLFADTLSELKPRFGDRFLLQASDHIEAVWDADAIRRVVENLCINAIKYGAPDRPVQISLIQVGDRVRIGVHNDGSPIPIAEQRRIFKEFGRSTAACTGQQKGWGLGLVLVKGLVEAHGGVVTLASAPEQGTTFTVELPTDSRNVAKMAA